MVQKSEKNAIWMVTTKIRHYKPHEMVFRKFLLFQIGLISSTIAIFGG